MKLGQWGLVQCNDPTFMFDFDFHVEKDSDLWHDNAEPVWSQLNCHPVVGYELIVACTTQGYDPKTNFVEWVLETIHTWLTQHEPTVDEDPFPKIDAHRAHDYSPWIKPT